MGSCGEVSRFSKLDDTVEGVSGYELRDFCRYVRFLWVRD